MLTEGSLRRKLLIANNKICKLERENKKLKLEVAGLKTAIAELTATLEALKKVIVKREALKREVPKKTTRRTKKSAVVTPPSEPVKAESDE